MSPSSRVRRGFRRAGVVVAAIVGGLGTLFSFAAFADTPDFVETLAVSAVAATVVLGLFEAAGWIAAGFLQD